MIMTKRTIIAAVAGALAVAAAASMAQAQTPSQGLPPGPAVQGVCVLSRDGVLTGSTVGKFVASRMQQLNQAAEAELTAQGTSFQNDAKAFDAARSTLSQQELNSRGTALANRQRQLEQLVNQRRQELQATEQKALQRVGQEADPIVRQVFQQRGCAVLLDANALVLISSSTTDITPAVVQGLNSKITQFTFDREHLEPAGQPAGQ